MDMEKSRQQQMDLPYGPLPEREKKPLFDLTKVDRVFAILTIIACVFTAVFGIFEGFALGYGVSSALMTALFFCYLVKGGKLSFWTGACGLLSLTLNCVFVCTSNGSVRFFTVLVSLLLTLLCLDGIVNGGAKTNRQTLSVFYGAICTIGNIVAAIKSLFSGNGERKTAGKALVGLLCAVPVMILVLPLLISSDEAFRGMMDQLFGDAGSTFGKLIFGLILSVFAVSYGFSMKAKRIEKLKDSKFAGIENVYAISFLSAIGACYLLYLFSQLAYFFSAFRGFLPDEEITYAQYARKGFFEMCMIAMINLVLTFLALILPKKKGGKVCNTVKVLATFIAVFTLIIIATAISKMVLYIGVYGMTILRLTTSAFMLFLAVVFVSVILRIYMRKINVVKTALIAAGSILLVLGLGNVNALCANYNYQSYVTGKLDAVDVHALYGLGDEGIVYLTKLAEEKDQEVAAEAQDYLKLAYAYHYFENVQDAEDITVDNLKKNQRVSGIGSYCLPKAEAYDALYEYLEKNPDFGKQCLE